MSRMSQRGEGRLKTVVTLAILVAIVYLCFKIIPAYVSNYELEDLMKSEARFAFVNRRTPEQLRETIYKKARDLDMPIGPENIRVETQTNGYRITVTYTVVIELPGYELKLDFKPMADSMSI
jgi:hypothetical protein